MDPIGKTSGKYGGSVREAGGTMGALEAARENQYFREQDAKKLDALRAAQQQQQQQQQQQPQQHQEQHKS